MFWTIWDLVLTMPFNRKLNSAFTGPIFIFAHRRWASAWKSSNNNNNNNNNNKTDEMQI